MSAFLDKIAVKRKNGEDVETSTWINRDIQPLPPSRRTWGPWSFVGFWLMSTFNISGWTLGSALLALGLNVWQAFICIIIGEVLVGLAVAANGLCGGDWHVGFPMINRFVWGLYGSFFPLALRILLSFVWYGCQLWFGAQVVKVILVALSPSFLSMTNTLPTSVAMETNDLICVLIFSVVSLPLLLVAPERYNKPFLYASISSAITCISIMIVCLAKQSASGGVVGGPLIQNPIALSGVKSAPEGAALAWTFCHAIVAVIGGICAGILNTSDYSRFARRPGDQILSQIIIVPVSSTLITTIGLVCTSCAAGFFPDDGLLWTPYGLLIAFMTHGGAGARAGAFFAGLAMLVMQFGINIAGNAISGGIDLSALFPKYINIRRGAYITAAIGLAINPWQLLNTANTFIVVMSSFGVFLGPATGMMVADYILTRQRRIKLSHLYMPNKSSIYWYGSGVNYRAVVAWVCGVFPLMPGFVAAVSAGTITVAEGWTHVYELAWIFGFVVSGLVIYTLNKLVPPPGVGEIDEYDYYGTVAGVHLPEGAVPPPPAGMERPELVKQGSDITEDKADYYAEDRPAFAQHA